MINWFWRKKQGPSPEDLVLSLCLNTASLGLKKQEWVEFAGVKGTCGAFKLTGNSLPCFSYTVFEKKIMEFIHVEVQVSRPDRIAFTSRISTEKRDEAGQLIAVLGDEVETVQRYREPFFTLAHHLYRYFPFPFEGGRKKAIEGVA